VAGMGRSGRASLAKRILAAEVADRKGRMEARILVGAHMVAPAS